MWHMDERVGQVAHDSSKHDNDGTIHHVRMGVDSRNGRAFRFNGRNSRILVDSSRSLNPGDDDFAVIAMVRFNTPPRRGEDYDLVRKGVSETDGGSYKMEIIHDVVRAHHRLVGQESYQRHSDEEHNLRSRVSRHVAVHFGAPVVRLGGLDKEEHGDPGCIEYEENRHERH